jgi:transcription termination factor Rho
MASFAESVHWMKKETTVVERSKQPVPSSQDPVVLLDVLTRRSWDKKNRMKIITDSPV